MYPLAAKVVLVLDSLNNHGIESLCEAFATRLLSGWRPD